MQPNTRPGRPTRTLARPDPRERLRQLKILILSITGAIAAVLWWLVAGHAVGSMAAAGEAAPVTVAAPQHDDDTDFFGSGSGLSDGGSLQPLMRSSGS
jgi:hypothetical protein